MVPLDDEEDQTAVDPLERSHLDHTVESSCNIVAGALIQTRLLLQLLLPRLIEKNYISIVVIGNLLPRPDLSIS